MSKHTHGHHGQEHTLWGELICHLPYAIFSVAFCLTVLSFMSFVAGSSGAVQLKKGAKMLFHSFHYMHIIFAATGTLITFFRFSKNLLKGLVVGMISTIFFCVLSDAVLPYIGGRLLGVDMHFHLCFLTNIKNVLPFLLVGLLNGVLMSRHHASKQGFYSLSSHFIHILISSLASSFYLVGHGFLDWHKQIGFVFLFLVVAIVIPCTLSDVVVPMLFARADLKK